MGQEVLEGPNDAETFPICRGVVLLCRQQGTAGIGDGVFFFLSHLGQDAGQGHVCIETEGQAIVGEGEYGGRYEMVLQFL